MCFSFRQSQLFFRSEFLPEKQPASPIFHLENKITSDWPTNQTILLKVRLSQNGFMKSSIFQKMNQKIWRISALCTVKTLRAEILQIFRVIFWKIDDLINPVWLNLTFRNSKTIILLPSRVTHQFQKLNRVEDSRDFSITTDLPFRVYHKDLEDMKVKIT